jgi:beta-xylosidase
MQEQVLFLRDTLDIKGIRFWGLFDADMELRMDHQTDMLNFDRLDEVLDFLVYNGLTPWIEFGDKPLIVSKTTTDNVRLKEGEPVFQVLSEYQEVLTKFIHHIITRYHAEQVRTWRFECYEDERTRRQVEFVSYFEIFNLTNQVIRSILPDAVIGGNGMIINDQRMEDFLQEWAKQPYRPDFFSAMSFPYEQGEASNGVNFYTRQSRDDDYLKRYVTTSKALLKKAGMNIPLYVTEWNCTISSRNYLNDTCYKGTYLLKNIIENLDDEVVLAYWAGSDLLASYYDSKNILNGSSGLITKDGICKSAYYAFRFLHRMGPWLVEAGENYLITTSGHFSYYIVCLNYHPLNDRYYHKPENEHTVKDVIALSQHNPSIRMAFDIDNLPDDHYTIKTSVISPNFGSVLDEWVRLNTIANVRKEDIDYLKRICTPHMSIQEMDTVNGSLNFEIELEAEQISLIHIYRNL